VVVPLRDVREDDLAVLFEQQRDPDATRMAAFPARDREAFMVHWTTKVLGNPSVRKKVAIVDGRVAGHVVSWDESGRRLVGYWIGKDYWGCGVATAALTEFLAQETVRPLFAVVAKHNAGSIRVLEKCGFVVVGEEDADGVLFQLGT
jgi:RimJ/RimL family protein N-acetyltransferase